MKFEIIQLVLGLIMVFFGVYLLYFMDVITFFVKALRIRGRVLNADVHLTLLMMFGVLFIVGGSWLVIDVVGLRRLLLKLVGVLFFFTGCFFVFHFPDSTRYQPPGFATISIFLGIVCYALSIYFLLFT